MHIAHHPILVVLSMGIACFGSWTALDLFRRVRAHVGVWRGAWLLASSVAMGMSIWAMHFIAMLGFNPGVEVRYDMRLTLLSLLLAIATTAFAFFSATQHNLRRLAIGGLVMGSGICIMHYVGMAAMITEFTISNDVTFIALAFLVAVTASSGALIAAPREKTLVQQALAALVLGSAIAGMHYTAMHGIRLLPSGGATAMHSGIDSITLAFGVAGGTFVILFLSLIAALSDRRVETLAAREASRSEQLLRAVIEHLPLGIYVAAAPTGAVRFANAEAAKLLGHPIGTEAIWSHDQRYGAIHADGRRLAPHEHVLHQAMQQGQRIGPRLQPYRRGDNEIVQLEVVAAPIPDREGGSALAVVAIQDVTAKLLAEEEMRQAQAEKAEAQAAMMHVQRLESLGRLTGGVAHDFNNMLTVIIGALDVILRHPENTERRTRLGEAALAAARRGERLTAQLLTFARRQPLRQEACDLNELIRVEEPLIRRAIGERSLDLHLCETPAVAIIDAAQFEATLLNLIVNAVDASDARSRISVETRLCELAAHEFPALTPGTYFCLRVTDTGMGMSPQVMDRMFEPFFTTKAVGKGTGLGLSQVYGFVMQSGGEVRVRSRPGEGTTFTIYLPVAERKTAESSQKKRVQPEGTKPLNILLTEDDLSVAAITEMMLKNLGHEVTRAHNAEQALQILHSRQQLDLLLSDIIMPGGANGLELARQAVAIRPDLQILLTSAYAGEQAEEALAQNAWPFLKKPYLQDELAASLQPFAKQDVAHA